MSRVGGNRKTCPVPRSKRRLTASCHFPLSRTTGHGPANDKNSSQLRTGQFLTEDQSPVCPAGSCRVKGVTRRARPRRGDWDAGAGVRGRFLSPSIPFSRQGPRSQGVDIMSLSPSLWNRLYRRGRTLGSRPSLRRPRQLRTHWTRRPLFLEELESRIVLTLPLPGPINPVPLLLPAPLVPGPGDQQILNLVNDLGHNV